MKTLLSRTVVLFLVSALPVAAQEGPTPADQERWQAVVEMSFPGRTPEPAGAVLALQAPARAADAALVPVGVQLGDLGSDRVTRLHLFIDDNPVPRAYSLSFGPASDPAGGVETRVRVNEYTWMHAVAETANGRLLQTAAFIKASGGCSAPAMKDPEAARARAGRMKLNLPAEIHPGQPVRAQLLISHPNATGMQFDQIGRTYIPADYVRQVSIRYNGRSVAEVETDIALSEDPSLHFAFVPDAAGGTLEVEARDSEGKVYRQSWPVPGGPS